MADESLMSGEEDNEYNGQTDRRKDLNDTYANFDNSDSDQAEEYNSEDEDNKQDSRGKDST